MILYGICRLLWHILLCMIISSSIHVAANGTTWFFFLWLNSIPWKDWCWSWNSSTLATWCEELTHWKRPWCWERLKAGGEGDDRGWDGWMASLTGWTWVCASSGSCWWTGKSGMLRSMGSQRVKHHWATELKGLGEIQGALKNLVSF